MTKVLLFTDTNCISCDTAENAFKKVVGIRDDSELVIFRRPQDSETFREYKIAICPAVFVDEKFVSYGSPDIGKLESALDARRTSRSKNAQPKTETKGEVE